MQRNNPRPLSPHLSIYKLPLVAITSISHRMTGVILFLGLIFLTKWLFCLAFIKDLWPIMESITRNMFFKFAALAWIFSLMYHLLNGIRHLFWDIGLGYSKTASRKSGITVIVLSIICTGIYVIKILN